jgi:hypothetical protein
VPFWEALEGHLRWQRRNLPTVDSRHGMALLIWLLKSEGRPRPIGQLYKDSRSSEPTMRACVKAFVEQGLAVIEQDPDDTRHRLLRGTPKLQQTVHQYRERLMLLAIES